MNAKALGKLIDDCQNEVLCKQAMEELRHLIKTDGLVHEWMRLAADAGQLGDFGSFDNWVKNALNLPNELRRYQAMLKASDEKLKNLEGRDGMRFMYETLERLDTLEYWMKEFSRADGPICKTAPEGNRSARSKRVSKRKAE